MEYIGASDEAYDRHGWRIGMATADHNKLENPKDEFMQVFLELA